MRVRLWPSVSQQVLIKLVHVSLKWNSICPGRYFSQETLGLMAASLLAVFNVEPSQDEFGKPIPLEYVPNGPMIV